MVCDVAAYRIGYATINLRMARKERGKLVICCINMKFIHFCWWLQRLLVVSLYAAYIGCKFESLLKERVGYRVRKLGLLVA